MVQAARTPNVVPPARGGNAMRCILAPIVLLVAAVALGAGDTPRPTGARDESPRATGTLDGKSLQFPEKGIADGMKATIGLLESCRDKSLYQADERKKAEQGDHIRL